MRRSLAVAAAAALVLAVVTSDVLNHGPFSARDAATVAWFATHRTGALDRTMEWASLSGGPSATGIYAALLTLAYWLVRRFRAGVAIAAIVYGGALLNVALKHAMGRGRPVLDPPMITLTTFSFPSGHAAAATIFGGVMCMIALQSRPAPAFRVLLAASLAWVTLVCISRVYLGVHYPTDVFAGIAEAVGWLALCCAVVRVLGVDVAWRPLVSLRP